MKIETVENQSKEQFRVVINREANESLEAFVTHVNRDNEVSRVTKSDIANYIFLHLKELINDSKITEIRGIYFDAKRALEGILKGASKGEDLPKHLREALLKHCGIKPATKEKRPKKLSTPKLVENVG